MKKILIAASALALLATVPALAQRTLGSAVDKLTTEAISGFLGLGDSYVHVNPSSFAVSVQDGTVKAYFNATKEQLKNAPKYTYRKG